MLELNGQITCMSENTWLRLPSLQFNIYFKGITLRLNLRRLHLIVHILLRGVLVNDIASLFSLCRDSIPFD